MKQAEVEVKRSDAEGLSAFVNLPPFTKEVTWEITTIPVNQKGGVPGPTDYVSLVAMIHVNEVSAKELNAKISDPPQIDSIPEQLIPTWLPEHYRVKLTKASANEKSSGLFDARFMLAPGRRALSSIGFISNTTLVLYINYVSPD